jgi:hypothetical protein
VYLSYYRAKAKKKTITYNKMKMDSRRDRYGSEIKYKPGELDRGKKLSMK